MLLYNNPFLTKLSSFPLFSFSFLFFLYLLLPYSGEADCVRPSGSLQQRDEEDRCQKWTG